MDETFQEVFGRLAREAWSARGRWVAFQFPSGTWAQMRVRPEDFRHELRLCREEMTAEWEQEKVALLNEALIPPTILGWHTSTEERVRERGVVSTFLALFPLEVEPGVVRCDCGSEIKTGETCSWCAQNRRAEQLKLMK